MQSPNLYDTIILLEINMDIVPIATLITAIATVILACATFFYAYTNRKLVITKEKEAERPRKKDELEQIINPMIRGCTNEIERIYKNQFWFFGNTKTSHQDILENDVKKMLYEDFITNHISLSRMIETHEKLIHKIKENCNIISMKFKDDKYQSKIKSMVREFNKVVKPNISKNSLSSLSTTLLINIIEDIDINDNYLGVPEKYFWKKFGKELLTLKNKDFKPQLEELNTLCKQLIQVNNDIIKCLKKICNEYTKIYGISLGEEIKLGYAFK